MEQLIVNKTGLQASLQARIDNRTKPLGSLGRLERIAFQLGVIQDTDHPCIRNPHIVVFAGDHGIARTGKVNPYPQSVTAQMVKNFVQGGAAINVFCRQHRIGLRVVDAGVNADLDIDAEMLIPAKIGYGTRNYLEEPAMTNEEADQAIETGRKIIRELAATGCNCLGLGEMGIGNSSSAALLMHLLTGIALDSCTGRGTGLDDEGLRLKKETLREAIRRRFPDQDAKVKPETALSQVGGFELAMMVGSYLEAQVAGMLIVVDGFIATAALLVALAMEPALMNHCVFAHRSGEQGHGALLDYLEATPLMDLGMRLGEGTGSALAIPIIQSAALFLEEMASFESAAVSQKK
jgi:nicotinate-nucleotide--dimethylbenzimidazole phosphoribosyltransferase